MPAGTRYPRPTVRSPSALAVLVLAALVASPAPVHAGPPLAPLPGSAPPAVATPAPASPAERLSRGVVTVEHDGRVLGIGSVLSGDGDGRILTALSPMGAFETADVRYADGSTVRAKIGHRDRAWDLALLVPLTGKWVDGLVASGGSAIGVPLQVPVALRAGRPAVVPGRVRAVIDARAKDGSTLSSVLDVELESGAGSSPTVGAPVTDGSAGVLGVLVKVCQATLPVVPSTAAGALPAPSSAPASAPAASAAAAAPCNPIVVAAPVAAIRSFLVHTPLTAVTPTPWLGIVGVPDSESNARGVRVMAIAPESPAQKGGLKASDDRAQADLIIAVAGQPVDSPERLAEMISRHAIGERVKLLVLTGGKFHEVAVVLRAAP